MFGLNDVMRYYVCQRYVRMNLGINGLYKLVSHEMDLPPLSGAVFIFFSKNRQQVKLLRWDTDGFAKNMIRKLHACPFVSQTGVSPQSEMDYEPVENHDDTHLLSFQRFPQLQALLPLLEEL